MLKKRFTVNSRSITGCRGQAAARRQKESLSRVENESPLEFAILITSPPLHRGSETAFQFLEAVLQKGHSIKQIFFYQDGVYHGNRLIYLENPNLITRWQMIARKHSLQLILCSASAARRGIMGETQATYFEKDSSNLAEEFQIGSLSLWFEAITFAERVMVFGDGP